MKAVVIRQFGGVDGLTIQEIPDPPLPTADRIRIRVHAAALNRADILQRLGRYPAPQGYPQEIPGLEFAGEVENVGPDVRTWKSGQRVFGIAAGGAQAELVTTPENQVAEIPQNLGWIEAAAVPEAFITAHDALFTQAKLTLGESLLVHAAGSGVGTAAIQLGHAAGATVFGTARTASKLELARAYGLNDSVVVGEDKRVIADRVSRWTNGRGIDVVLDLVGGAYLNANLEALAIGGRMLLVGTTSGSTATLDYGVVMRKRLKLIGTVLRTRSAEEKATATRLFGLHVLPLLETGRVRPVVDSTFKLEDIGEAHRRLESNESFGKVVLTVSQK
jgi:putative PIG3 family NAD(P)H quinone oxidoreductase